MECVPMISYGTYVHVYYTLLLATQTAWHLSQKLTSNMQAYKIRLIDPFYRFDGEYSYLTQFLSVDEG